MGKDGLVQRTIKFTAERVNVSMVMEICLLYSISVGKWPSKNDLHSNNWKS